MSWSRIKVLGEARQGRVRCSKVTTEYIILSMRIEYFYYVIIRGKSATKLDKLKVSFRLPRSNSGFPESVLVHPRSSIVLHELIP